MTKDARIKELEDTLKILRTWAVCDVEDRPWKIKTESIVALCDKVLKPILERYKA